MKTLAEYRAMAREKLKGNWNSAAVFMLVVFLIIVVISGIFGSMTMLLQKGSLEYDLIYPVLDLVSSLLMFPLIYGLFVSFLNLGRGRSLHVEDLPKYYNKRFWLTIILQTIYIYLWTLLLIIPGIVKAYSYALTPYILADNPELSNNAAIEKSMAMMKGHKMKLFLLDLSFIGWFLLCIVTLCIATLWVAPYMYQARAVFYETLKAESDPTAL